jgi:hypothetical protein
MAIGRKELQQQFDDIEERMLDLGKELMQRADTLRFIEAEIERTAPLRTDGSDTPQDALELRLPGYDAPDSIRQRYTEEIRAAQTIEAALEHLETERARIWKDMHLLDDPMPPLPGTQPSIDVGVALLEPVTAAELGQVEIILGLLQRTVDADELTELQQHQVLAMADMIRARQRASTPDQTPRHEIVGATRSALFWMVDLPQGAVAWGLIINALTRVGWTDIANTLLERIG